MIQSPNQDVRVEYVAEGKSLVLYRLPSAGHTIPGQGKGGPSTPTIGREGGIPGNETLRTGRVIVDEFNNYIDGITPPVGR